MKTSILFLFIIILFSYFVYSVSVVLTPFIISLLIAYLLNPSVKFFVTKGFSRAFIVASIVAIFIILLVSVSFNLLPALFEQIQQFVVSIPRYEAYVEANLLPKITTYIINIDSQFANKIRNLLTNYSSNFFQYLMLIVQNLFDSSIAFLNLIGLVLFTPILVFYLLKDWNKVIDSAQVLLPKEYKEIVLEQLDEIDNVLSSYIRGQFNVCFIVSLYYIICLSLLGVNNALLIGIITGVLIIIPYLGVIIGFIICTIASLIQFDEIKYVYASIIIFISGHLFESFFITPKLVGEKVGLHPVWVIFSLMAGGTLFGFWGMFFAIPIAAICGVLLRSSLRVYFSSQLYNLHIDKAK